MVGEAGYVMLGVTHPNDFIGNLAERLEVDKEKARAIAQEINEQIFKKVRESLRKIIISEKKTRKKPNPNTIKDRP